ncbi:MAG TPA: P1 family peptidase [Acidimicrobiia bacterium]|nr:P1 family peptidase [Acidimicrobiia bacterium]
MTLPGITSVPGIRVGHWTGPDTGVTVVWAPAGTVGSGEVRGGAPATRETALLDPTRLVEQVDAVVLAGGSAFGLAAADGVVRFLAERGQGFPTPAGPVPIVVAAALFDLPVARPPGPDEGWAAAVDAARAEPVVSGRVGAGRGATVGKWRGREHSVVGGLGTAAVREGGATVGALVACNPLGDVIGAGGQVLAGSTAPESTPGFPVPTPFENTTLVVVATDARLDKAACHLLAQSAHDGLARAIRPAHTRYDGDFAAVLATGEVDESPDRLRVAATDVVAAAVRAAVGGDRP